MRSLRCAHPIVDLRIFFRRGILLAAITAGAAYGATAIQSSMLPLIAMTPPEAGADYVLGFTAGQYAWLVAQSGAMTVLAGIVVGKTLNRFGAAFLMKAGLLFLALGALQAGLFHQSYWQLLIASVLVGTGTGLTYGSVPGLVIASARPSSKRRWQEWCR